jgi:outer membrane protein
MGLRGFVASCGLASLAAMTLSVAAAQAQSQPHSAPKAPPKSLSPALPQPQSATDTPHTLQEALAAAYSNNPTLQGARAQLRATDEGVPAALAGWRPTVTLGASAGPAFGDTRTLSGATAFSPATAIYTKEGRNVDTLTATVTQPLYRGGKTRASTNQAENKVMQQRASLIASEQTLFTNVVNAYVTVIEDQELLALDINNEQVLAKQLQATNDRFRVGEITRTDVAQAEAALAGATATRQTAEGTLAAARASYQQLVGALPDRLIEPQPLKLPTADIDAGRALSAANNPNVVAALYAESAAKDNFDLQYSALMPNLSLVGQAFRDDNVTTNYDRSTGGQLTANLTVPIYQGGSEYAAIRQARQLEQQARNQVDDARRTAISAFVNAWETYQAAKSTIESTRAQIRSNEIALEGVQREAIVGSRTTLDVLNAEQTLLNSRTTLVQNLASFVTASYSVASAVGRLTARDLNLNVPLYDETAYYNAVRDRWIGTGDFATEQPGR